MNSKHINANATAVVSILLFVSSTSTLIGPSVQLIVMNNNTNDLKNLNSFEEHRLPEASYQPTAISILTPMPMPMPKPKPTPTSIPNINNRFAFESVDLNESLNVGLLNASMNINDSYAYIDDDINCIDNQNVIVKSVTMILYAIVCIIGLFGNTLVIYVVLRFSKMQTVTNIYILNLAIADECFLIGIPFLLYTMQIGSWTFGEYMCKAYLVSTSITQFTSSIFLLIMSADRYIAVCHPISSPRYRTPFVSKVVSAIAWMTSVLLMLPVILFASTVESSSNHFSCIIKWTDAQNTQSYTFILYTLVLGFATPLTFILVFYYLVIRKLHTVGPKHKSKEKKRSHRKVTKLVLTVITVYIICWLPHWISQVALINSSTSNCASRLEVAIFLLCGCLSYSNSAMNPILYAFLSDNFKKSFMKACTCATRKDVNAQLQLENSFFPKFGKNRQSDRLIGVENKRKPMKALMARNANGAHLVNMANTTNTTATTTTTGCIGNHGQTYAEGVTFVYPAVHTQPAPAVAPVDISDPPPIDSTNALPFVLSNSAAENTPPDKSFTSNAGTTKPPVLYTDL